MHFFFHCPLYYTQRLKLRDAVTRLTEITIETILYGDENISYQDNLEIVQAVHNYILESERFDT